MKKYGCCYNCRRIVSANVLDQILFYEFHKHNGSFHHKLLCWTCIKKADEAGEEIEKDK